jgi:potassium efflux system protein
MTRILSALLLCALLLSSALSSAVAQQQADPGESIDRIAIEVELAEKEIAERGSEDEALLRLRTQLEAAETQLLGLGVAFRPRLSTIQSRLEALGQPPGEGQPPEPPAVNAERDSLTAERVEINLKLAEAEDLSVRINAALDRISDLRRENFSKMLFNRTSATGVFNPETLRTIRDDVSQAFRIVTSRLSFLWNFRTQSLIYAVSLSLLLALATWLLLRRTLAPSWMRLPPGGAVASGEPASDQGPSYLERLAHAFWSILAPSLSVALSVIIMITLFIHFGIFASDSLTLFENLLIVLLGLFFIHRLLNAVLAPGNGQYRLLPITDAAARSLFWLATLVAMVNLADFYMGVVYDVTASPLQASVSQAIVASVLISGFLILIALLKPLQDAETGKLHAWPAWFRVPLLLIAGFIITAAVTGYVGLARFAATQVVVTGAILATMYIGVKTAQALAAEGALPATAAGRLLANRASMSEESIDRLGLILSLLAYATVALVGLPLIALQWGFRLQEITGWAARFLTNVSIGSFSISPVGILFGIGVFAIGYLLTRRFGSWLDRNVMRRSGLDAGVRNSVRTVTGYAGIGLAALIGLSAAGFDLSNLAIVAGALSLGIGFGLQNIVNNFVSGLILLVERPFKVGDWIEAGTTSGFVRKISVRATEIETFQHQTVILPNSELINSKVGNWTLRNKLGRVDIPVGVGYESDPRHVHELLLEVANADAEVLRKPAPAVVFSGFGASSLDFELRVHIGDVLNVVAAGTRLRIAIHEKLKEAGIAIPFPQRDVNLRITDVEAIAEAFRNVPATAPEPIGKPKRQFRKRSSPTS